MGNASKPQQDEDVRARLETDTIRLLAQATDALATSLKGMSEQDLRGIGLLATVIAQHCASRTNRHFREATAAVLRSL